MYKRILVVVDMQNDFITGSLGNAETQAVASNVLKKLEAFGETYDKIYFTQDTHFDDYGKTLEGERLPVKHCTYRTEGWALCPEINTAMSRVPKKVTTVCVEKDTFGAVAIANMLREVIQDKTYIIELVGVCTDICVVSNALLLRTCFPNNVIRVDSKCCAGTSVEAHNAALKVMQSCQIDII